MKLAAFALACLCLAASGLARAQDHATVEQLDEKTYLIRIREAAVFTNWIPVRRKINALNSNADVIVDLSETLLVDHTVMEKLHEMEREFKQSHRRLEVTGLDGHDPFSAHPHAARKKVVGREAVAR